MRSQILILSLAAVLASCGPTGLDCGEPTALAPHPNDPTFLGAPLGPLLIRNFAGGETRAVVSEYSPGYALKFVTAVARPFDRALTLSGRRCADGIRLRFAWSYPFAFNSTPAPSDVFAAAGEETALVQPVPRLPASGVAGAPVPPYFLFASPGKWQLEVRDGASVVDRAILLVR